MTEEQAKEEQLSGRCHYNEEIRVEQVKQLYVLAPVGIMATVVNATITFFVFGQGGISEGLLIPWFATVSIVTLLRIGLVLSFRARFRPKKAAFWGKSFLAGLVLIGAAWGILGAFPFAGPSATQRVFIAFVLGGMAAGAATTFSSLRGGCWSTCWETP
jgi:hypothetical protein